MPIFGGRKPSGNDAEHDPEAQEQREPDERSQLLPRHVDRDGPYLDPNDPAVSPYNLFTVRAARYFTIFLTVVTGVWWTLTLVSTFITLPGLETRGSPFFAFSYTTIAMTTLLVTLLFFGAPARSIRILAAFTALFLFASSIIMVATEQPRHEEVWLGVISVFWATLMAIWTVVADRTVQWGKAEEEERLTGRPETRRTLLEWVEVTFSSTALLILCVASILTMCTLILRALDAGLIEPGTRFWVDGDKYRMHVYCHGSKSRQRLPTVLFEGGEDPVESELWGFAKDTVASGSITRYCFVDRPGIAWSETAPSPLSAGQATEALSEALARAGEGGPWVLVSAGIGSIYSRVFSSRHGEEIKGILMIDPLHEDLLHRVAAPGRGFSLWIRGIMSPLGLDRIPGAILRGRTSADRIWGKSAYQDGKTIFAKLQEGLVADSLTKRDVIAARAIQYQDTPLAIISSGVECRNDGEWERKQRDLTRITHNLTNWDIVDKAPHQVWRTEEGRAVMEKRLKKLVHGVDVIEFEEEQIGPQFED